MALSSELEALAENIRHTLKAWHGGYYEQHGRKPLVYITVLSSEDPPRWIDTKALSIVHACDSQPHDPGGRRSTILIITLSLLLRMGASSVVLENRGPINLPTHTRTPGNYYANDIAMATCLTQLHPPPLHSLDNDLVCVCVWMWEYIRCTHTIHTEQSSSLCSRPGKAMCDICGGISPVQLA